MHIQICGCLAGAFQHHVVKLAVKSMLKNLLVLSVLLVKLLVGGLLLLVGLLSSHVVVSVAVVAG